MTARRVDQGMAVAAAEALPPTVDSELRARYRQLRIMLHSAGLAATYAYIASKARDAGDQGTLAAAYEKVCDGIRTRLRQERLLTGDGEDAPDILATLGAMGPVEYARASAEAAAFVGWLSRLADADWQEREPNA